MVMMNDDKARFKTLKQIIKFYSENELIYNNIYLEPDLFFYLCRLKKVPITNSLKQIKVFNATWNLGTSPGEEQLNINIENWRKQRKEDKEC